MPSISQEMTAEERRKRLLHGLNATGEPEVVVNFGHLAHALGMDTAEGLVNKLVQMDGLVPGRFSKEPKLHTDGLCAIDRLSAIAAIERVQVKTAKASIDKKLL